jgi:multidrug efflux system membrane fusion protein
MDEPKNLPPPANAPANAPPSVNALANTAPPASAPANTPPPATAPPIPSADPEARRKIIGRTISIAVVAGVIVLALWVWSIIERHPRTDDAFAAANVIGVAPRVRGQIIKVNVQDNQEVKEGELLFEIDPADYQLALDNAQAAQAALEQQIEVARSQDETLKYQVKAAQAGVEQAQAEQKQVGDTLARIQPLLTNGFATADDVDKAETAVKVAAASLATAEQRLNSAKTALSTLATLRAQRPGAAAAVEQARLNLSYCQVVAPFPGKVINLNFSVGQYANAGVPVFSLLDLRHWYVIANFREGEIRHFTTGSTAEVYLLSVPARRFLGKVQGIGWAVSPRDEIIDTSGGVPTVPRELNWVHIAQRFPVRIEVQNPDLELFRLGASAVAMIK